MLVRQTHITFDQQEIIKQFKMENFFNELLRISGIHH